MQICVQRDFVRKSVVIVTVTSHQSIACCWFLLGWPFVLPPTTVAPGWLYHAGIVRPIVYTMTGPCFARKCFSHLASDVFTSYDGISWPLGIDRVLQLSLDLPGAYIDAGHELQEALQERSPVSHPSALVFVSLEDLEGNKGHP